LTEYRQFNKKFVYIFVAKFFKKSFQHRKNFKSGKKARPAKLLEQEKKIE